MYQIIYADPPWKYPNERSSGAAAHHYTTMSEKEIKEYGKEVVLPLVDENCALMLWATLPKLPTALKVMRAWGFKYKTVFATWIKIKKGKKEKTPTMGRGYYTRGNTEICLLGIRGKGSKLRRPGGEAIPSVVQAEKREHSRKPDEVRKMIEQVFQDGLRKIELFAREKAPGWDCVGNETDKFESKTPEVDVATAL
jgi:N6-adenosine-specific RNA methylase IME4